MVQTCNSSTCEVEAWVLKIQNQLGIRPYCTHVHTPHHIHRAGECLHTVRERGLINSIIQYLIPLQSFKYISSMSMKTLEHVTKSTCWVNFWNRNVWDKCVWALNFAMYFQVTHQKELTIYVLINNIRGKKGILFRGHISLPDEEVVLQRV